MAFTKRHGYSDLPVSIPCGQCRACRLEYSRQWAMRILHEASLYPSNLFLTLTYADEHLPDSGSLDVRHWQLFMKRLKKRLGGRMVRFYHCGEYGETTGRPHYHACVFDIDFGDKVYLKTTDSGHPIYISAFLDEVWGLGDCYIGEVTFESAAYCARYVMKKLTGQRKSEYGSLQPEYCTQSRRPGIGAPWLAKWKADVFPNDFCVINGKRVKVPKYYDTLVDDGPSYRWEYDSNGVPVFVGTLNQTVSEKRRGNRKRNAAKHSGDNTPERLSVREEILERRLQRLARS